MLLRCNFPMSWVGHQDILYVIVSIGVDHTISSLLPRALHYLMGNLLPNF